jgi:formate dehydrogenase major subunit
MPKIRVNIDGKEINAYSGHTILEIAKQNSIDIPTLCHNDKLKNYGSCGMCVVEIENNPRLIRACSTQIQDGMVIKTSTDRVRESRKTTLELMLSDHSGDCKAPCMLGCPSNVDVQGYVGLSANKEYEEALKLIKEDLPLPASIGRVCPHPCQTACRRGVVDDAISIAWIKRFVADMDLEKEAPYLPAIKDNTNKRIAVIGGGPGGLSAAYFLRRAGHEVAIYEAMPEFGGMLKYGIPLYRLPKDVLKGEIEVIERMGVKLIPNTRVGTDITLDHIRREFDAVYVSIGAWKSSYLNCPGSDNDRIIGGIEFLNKFAINEPIRTGNRIAVIGGGNTAMDACRTSIRLGAKEVYAIYRRTKDDMPAVDVEIEEAEEEGVTFKFLSNPTEFIADADGNVTHIRLEKMKQGEPDASGRRRVIPTGEEELLAVDSVIMSIGQRLSGHGFDDIALNERGNIHIDPSNFQTNLDGVFAGGDAVENGAGIAIEAIADGKHAAESITHYLKGATYKRKDLYTVKRKDMTKEHFPHVASVGATQMGHVAPEERKQNFEEVVHGFTTENAVYEANRCLECGCMDSHECNLFQFSNDYDVQPERLAGLNKESLENHTHPHFYRDNGKCILCGMCVRICEEVMDHGVLGFVNRGFDTVVQPALDKPLKETDCISCGQCVSICPTGALQERHHTAKQVPLMGEFTDSICDECGMGCTIKLESKGGMLLRSLPNKGRVAEVGILCEKGRFELVKQQNQDRLSKPLVRKNGQLEEVSWEEAILYTARKSQSLHLRYGENAVATMISGKYYNETIYLIKKMANESFNTEYVYSTKGYERGLKDIFGYDASTNLMAELDRTDMIVTIGTQIMERQPVMGVRIRKAAGAGAKLMVINKEVTKADEWADRAYYNNNDVSLLLGVAKYLLENHTPSRPVDGLEAFTASLEKAHISDKAKEIGQSLLSTKNVLFVFDRSLLSDEAVMLIGQIALLSDHIGRPRNGLIQLREDGNTQGLIDLGINMNTDELDRKVSTGEVKGLIVFGPEATMLRHRDLELLVVQEEVLSPLGMSADVVIPSPTLIETSGTMTSQERKIQVANAAINPNTDMTNLQQIQRIMDIFGNREQQYQLETLLEDLGKEIPEYLHASDHLQNGRGELHWPVGSSPILYENNFATDNGSAKLHSVNNSLMYL